MGSVTDLPGSARDLDPHKVLDAAFRAGLVNAMVIGETHDGSVYFAMSSADGPLNNWLLCVAQRSLMTEAMEPVEE